MVAQELEGLGGSRSLPVDPEVMEPEQASEENPGLLIPCDDDCGRGFRRAQGPFSRRTGQAPRSRTRRSIDRRQREERQERGPLPGGPVEFPVDRPEGESEAAPVDPAKTPIASPPRVRPCGFRR